MKEKSLWSVVWISGEHTLDGRITFSDQWRCRYVCVCVGREFLIQGFIFNSIVVVKKLFWKLWIFAIRYNAISYLNKTLPDLTPRVWYFWIFDIAQHIHLSLFCILSQLWCFVVIIKTMHGPNSGSVCSSPNIISCRANDVLRKSELAKPTLPYTAQWSY